MSVQRTPPMASDEDDVIVCEPCGRAADVLGVDAAQRAGWAECWDGWVCPECRKEFPDGE